jgi:hypothetical protein
LYALLKITQKSPAAEPEGMVIVVVVPVPLFIKVKEERSRGAVITLSWSIVAV